MTVDSDVIQALCGSMSGGPTSSIEVISSDVATDPKKYKTPPTSSSTVIFHHANGATDVKGEQTQTDRHNARTDQG